MTIDYMSTVSAITILIRRLKNLQAIGYELKIHNPELVKLYVNTNKMLSLSYPEEGGIGPSALKISGYFLYNFVEQCPIHINKIPLSSDFNNESYRVEGAVDFKLVTEDIVPFLGLLVVFDICSIANREFEFNKHVDFDIYQNKPSFERIVVYTNPGFLKDFIQLLKVGVLNPQGIVMSLSALMEGLHGYRRENVESGW
ncbi:MAG: hypothetical protein QM523_01310 [Candidatus Pacebacteria bacterium]|nr:hypothetical protein [Candidatus Paceibacterota bacterium]